jgi:hypothetical protein
VVTVKFAQSPQSRVIGPGLLRAGPPPSALALTDKREDSVLEPPLLEQPDN